MSCGHGDNFVVRVKIDRDILMTHGQSWLGYTSIFTHSSTCLLGTCPNYDQWKLDSADKEVTGHLNNICSHY